MTTYVALTTVVLALIGACGRTKKEMITDLYVEIIYKTERGSGRRAGMGWGWVVRADMHYGRVGVAFFRNFPTHPLKN